MSELSADLVAQMLDDAKQLLDRVWTAQIPDSDPANMRRIAERANLVRAYAFVVADRFSA